MAKRGATSTSAQSSAKRRARATRCGDYIHSSSDASATHWSNTPQRYGAPPGKRGTRYTSATGARAASAAAITAPDASGRHSTDGKQKWRPDRVYSSNGPRVARPTHCNAILRQNELTRASTVLSIAHLQPTTPPRGPRDGYGKREGAGRGGKGSGEGGLASPTVTS